MDVPGTSASGSGVLGLRGFPQVRVQIEFSMARNVLVIGLLLKVDESTHWKTTLNELRTTCGGPLWRCGEKEKGRREGEGARERETGRSTRN